MTYQAHITMKSRNAKTGKIPVSTTTAKSCPNSCPLKGNGCYADNGPLGLFWRKITDCRGGAPWDDFCYTVEHLMPQGQLWRHNQAGDLPSKDGEVIDIPAFNKLVRANKGKRGFTFTHHDMTYADNRFAAWFANRSGFTVNLSANSLENADELADLQIAPVVTIVPEDFPYKGTTPGGRKVVVCPAQEGTAESCATCQLCQRRERKVIVGFRVHGTTKKRAAQVLGHFK